MSRKDYILLAQAFSVTRPEKTRRTAYAQWEMDIDRVSWTLGVDNYRFDSERFLDDCNAD